VRKASWRRTSWAARHWQAASCNEGFEAACKLHLGERLDGDIAPGRSACRR